MDPARPSPAPPPPTPAPAPAPFDAARALLADLPRPEPPRRRRRPLPPSPATTARSAPLGDLAVFLAGWTGGKPISKPLFAFYVATYAEPGGLPRGRPRPPAPAP